jgi:choline transport protein
MADEKNLNPKELDVPPTDDLARESVDGSENSVADKADMDRMGKSQQLGRNFHQWTMVFFTSMIQATWEVVLVANTSGLVNGGLAGLFWSYIWTFLGFLAIVLSLAEMSSMHVT